MRYSTYVDELTGVPEFLQPPMYTYGSQIDRLLGVRSFELDLSRSTLENLLHTKLQDINEALERKMSTADSTEAFPRGFHYPGHSLSPTQ